MLLSILVPTLEARRALFERLHADLAAQVERCAAQGEVEILSLRDGGQAPVGAKRNALLARAGGRFVAFVDDDDAVEPEYVGRILGALRAAPGVDCLGIRARITFRGRHPRPMLYSARVAAARTVDGVYHRPAQHLNPMRREIALRFPFAEVRRSEDFDFGRRLHRAGALREEVIVEGTLYHYRSRRFWAYQRALDATEPVRNALGLRRVNLLRLPGRGRPAPPLPGERA